MSAIRTESWDGGGLLVNAAFADWLARHELTTFAAIDALPLNEVARRVKTRVTARLTLASGGEARHVYLKKHDGYPLSELAKPLLRFTRPVLGARTEWEAMLQFHELQIPTMTPILYGCSGGRSFVMTEALDGYERADLWLEQRLREEDPTAQDAVRELSDTIAGMARVMHAAGLHHQDFYLCHFLIPNQGPPSAVRLIDLGRVRSHRRLPQRWITKDLAQLHFSSEDVSCRERVRFLHRYLGRPLQRQDRRLFRAVERKRLLIARHTAKHKL